VTENPDPAQKTKRPGFSPIAVPRELVRLTFGLWRHASIGIPLGFAKSLTRESAIISWSDRKVYDIVGDALLNVVDSWGPLYGKAMQIWCSRIGPKGKDLIERLGLDRVYGDWPPLDWDTVQKRLDVEIPLWRDLLQVEPVPLGVASMSQVHAARDEQGRPVVVKLLKPHAVMRLNESIAAIESSVIVAEPFAMTRTAKRLIIDVRHLCDGLRQEMDLSFELRNMKSVRDLVEKSRTKAICVPETMDLLCNKNVIVMQRLEGIKLSDVVSGRATIDEASRKVLAKRVLSELLVQIFEWGLFHADPHAGNLMLLPDGVVGLYDWGLAGELIESDRKYIAGILRSVMTMNLEGLIDVLQEMGRETRGVDIEREKIRSELHALSKMLSQKSDSTTSTSESSTAESAPGLNAMIDHALSAAERLGITMPQGLLLMAKSLVTIEGLARGLDKDVAFARVAGPVLFRAASPGIGDILGMVRQLPKIAGKWLKK
jgi:ubiquinone biosynthesis protein